MKIRNDKELISEEEYKEILEKNKKIKNKSISNEEKNFKGKIRDYYKFFLEEKNTSYKVQFLKEYNKSIIQFIETFDFDNLENITIFEKLYLYVKLLFDSYCNILFWEKNIGNDFEEELKTVSKKYLKLLFKKNPYYINRLIPIFSELKDAILYDIVIFSMKLYYDNGIKYLESQNTTYKNYKARNEFINCLKLGNEYINKRRLALLSELRTESLIIGFKVLITAGKSTPIYLIPEFASFIPLGVYPHPKSRTILEFLSFNIISLVAKNLVSTWE